MNIARLGKSKHLTKILIGLTVFLISIVIFSIFYLTQKSQEILNLTYNFSLKPPLENLNQCKNCQNRLIDGKLVSPENINPNLIAITIDNHFKARPPAGLSEANLVYEVEAEGGITRYLAIFTSDANLDRIGPIRSVRSYFLDWTQELSALLVHCGGSPDALAKITSRKITNLNEFYKTSSFWRDSSLIAPHNIFTSHELLKKYLEVQKIKTNNLESWKFKNETSLEERGEGQEILIPFLPGYQAKWEYNLENNNYLRYLNDKLHLDSGKKEIVVKNIVLHYTETQVIDSQLRLEIKTLGSGQAEICQDGFCYPAKWKKKSPESRTKYYTLEGKEVSFNPGITWIQVMDTSYKDLIEK